MRYFIVPSRTLCQRGAPGGGQGTGGGRVSGARKTGRKGGRAGGVRISLVRSRPALNGSGVKLYYCSNRCQ